MSHLNHLDTKLNIPKEEMSRWSLEMLLKRNDAILERIYEIDKSSQLLDKKTERLHLITERIKIRKEIHEIFNFN